MLSIGNLKKWWFRSRSPVLLGIDISLSSVKVVELARLGDELVLQGYANVPILQQDSQNPALSKIETMGMAVKKALRQVGTELTHAVSAVPNASVITKVLKFPSELSDDEIAAQIELEAEHYIPYPINEVSLDFTLLDTTDHRDGFSDVLVVAARREQVEDRAAILEWAGLRADIMDVDVLAMERALSRSESVIGGNEGYAIVDAGASTTGFHVVKNGQVIFSREHNFGGRQLTEDIQRRYGLSPNEAELAKIRGGLPDSYEGEVLAPFIDSMAQQIARALFFFRSSHPGVRVDHMVFSGGCVALPGIEAYLDQIEGVRVVLANPFQAMSIHDRLDHSELERVAPAMLTATGLALRSFD